MDNNSEERSFFPIVSLQSRWRAALFVAALTLLPTAAAQVSGRAKADLAPDRAGVWYGIAPGTRSATVGLQWELPWYGTLRSGGQWSTHVEASLGHWRPKREFSSVTQLGAMPVVRYSFSGPAGPFAEAGLGINLITPRYEATTREFSTQFQFNESIGVGWRSATARGWAITLRWQHFSNSGIKKPNPGENFTQLQFVLDL